MVEIKKKNVVLGGLVVLLLITGYINLIYNQDVAQREEAGVDVRDAEVAQEEQAETPGDGQLAATDNDNFFRDFRFERESTRRQETEYIMEVIDNPDADPQIRQEAKEQLLEIAGNMEKELRIETLIKAKGFEDVAVLLQKDSVNVIVDRPELMSEEVARILEIVIRESGQEAENVKIIPKM
jgi:stage III sporulation protein AH